MIAASAFLGYRCGRTHDATPRGIASLPAVSKTAPCVDFRDAGSHLGEAACISGRVLRVFTSRAGNTFLDFCPDYRTCPFTTVIFSSDRSKFGDLARLEGRQVEIRGAITTYQGRAEIIIHDPQQIRVLP